MKGEVREKYFHVSVSEKCLCGGVVAGLGG